MWQRVGLEAPRRLQLRLQHLRQRRERARHQHRQRLLAASPLLQRRLRRLCGW